MTALAVTEADAAADLATNSPTAILATTLSEADLNRILDQLGGGPLGSGRSEPVLGAAPADSRT